MGAVLEAVRKDRARIVDFLRDHKELVKEMAERLLREMVADKPALEKLLRAVNVIDDDETR